MSSKEEKDAINLLSLGTPFSRYGLGTLSLIGDHLDGGGVRGVASLLILHEIMVKIQEIKGLDKIPKPCDYFHMIGGTSTGGLIAIMLGRLRMSTEEALREYDHFAKKIFSFRNKKWSRATEKFRATALQDAVQDLVRRRGMGEDLYDHTLRYNSKGQCFVCAMPAKEVGQPWRLRSFRSDYERADSRVKIWEAARATTAATYFFKPTPLLLLPGEAEDFIDAAIGCNNPVEYLIKEAADGIGSSERFGCLISIGTGTRIVQMERASTGLKNILHLPGFIKAVVGTLKNTATDGEEAHRRVQAKLGGHSNAYFRFNIPGIADQVRLHEHRKINELKAITATHLGDPSVASQLLAAATVMARNSPEHRLSLGHIDGVDKDQIIPTDNEVLPLGDISRFFIGRDDVLAQVDACFPIRDTRGKPRREFLLYGMGGVGKTQTALKAADLLEDRFKFVFNVDGTDTLTATRSYAKIYQEHCQQEILGPGTTEEMKNVALKWMGQLSDEWLLIYDNHPDHERLQPILPPRHSGNIIYTSRSRRLLVDLPADCVCEIQPLPESDAVDLLLRISGRESFRSDEEETMSASELVAKLGNLPLAIESAGAYIRQREMSVFRYLQRFRDQTQRSALLSSQESDSSLPARPSLYTALDLSYDAISTVRRRKGRSVAGRAAKFALKVLNLLCFYHYEEIPISMIRRAAIHRHQGGCNASSPLHMVADPNDPDTDASELLYFDISDEEWGALPFFLGVRMLRQFSLVKLTRDDCYVSMHVMVQEWALDRIKAENRPRLALTARIVLAESIKPGLDLVDHMYLHRIPPHVHACLAHEPATGILDPVYQSQLDFKLGWFYNEEHHFPAAAEHLAKAASVWEAETGPDSRTTTFGLGLLANVYREMGRWRDAETTYRDVIKRLHNRQEQNIAACDGLARGEAGRQSREAMIKELTGLFGLRNHVVSKMTGGKKDKTTDEKSQGVPALTVTGSSSSVDSRRATPNPTTKTRDMETEEDWYSELAAVGADLALVLLDQGRFGAAKKCWMTAISMLKEQAGRSPDDLQVWAWEVELKLHLEPEDKEYWGQRLSELRALPPVAREELITHQISIVTIMGYATAMLAGGRPKDGYEIYEWGLKSLTRIHGASNRKMLMLMRDMALCLMELGRFEEAEEVARTALERARACYGQHHLQTAECLLRVSDTLLHQTMDLGPGSEYRGMLQDAYDSARIAFSDSHYLAVRIKKRMDRGLAPRPPPTAEDDADVQKFNAALREAVGKTPISTEEEFEALKNVVYREWLRKKTQAELKPSQAGNATSRKVEKPSQASTATSLEVEVGSSGGSGQEKQEAPGKTPRWRKKQGSRQKASTKLSPILEGDTGKGDTGEGDTGEGDTGEGDTGEGDTGEGDTSEVEG
ncbi:hypothetical protein C8A05DRAFT_11320 [Staphylotrichum tortipilum]|uniref:PNPLA domain-containing protein n=1 Tax=Staphylotrichum tortipilum TaxID=2831512 RepID=A0AAN6RXC2_9PEZI|nr:hypothetical protein C8A05DRAFT_11320 [Staphylotrichum longicolle]